MARPIPLAAPVRKTRRPARVRICTTHQRIIGEHGCTSIVCGSKTGGRDEVGGGSLVQIIGDIDAARLVERILLGLREQMPALRAVPPALMDDVRRAVEESTEAGLRVLTGRETSGAHGNRREEQSLKARYSAVAQRRALQGVPLELSLLGYEIGSAILLAEVVERLPPTADAVAILAEASRRIVDHIHLATSAVAVGYQDASAAGAVDQERRVQPGGARGAKRRPVAGRRTPPDGNCHALPMVCRLLRPRSGRRGGGGGRPTPLAGGLGRLAR